MNKIMGVSLFIFLLFLALAANLFAHAVHYDVQQKGISTRIFYSADDPANYAEYELFGPGDDIPYQTGRTDKNGFVCFLPNRSGEWKVKVMGESSHGFHGVVFNVTVDEAMHLESFEKPLLAMHTKLITGVSLIIGIFGLLGFWASRRKTLDGAG